ncbi:hypothetical protein PBR20603_04648 [Pandoraea bronchicola]|uniref:Uncharacterized protein n=1 Tax=Pandoraea bronchicola TaxID=2508287 RepID=A0A5E5BWE3_9BURK|nr:hypothetical protein PBR20603_04648 [Pandoraea bronchicola]
MQGHGKRGTRGINEASTKHRRGLDDVRHRLAPPIDMAPFKDRHYQALLRCRHPAQT